MGGCLRPMVCVVNSLVGQRQKVTGGCSVSVGGSGSKEDAISRGLGSVCGGRDEEEEEGAYLWGL